MMILEGLDQEKLIQIQKQSLLDQTLLIWMKMVSYIVHVPVYMNMYIIYVHVHVLVLLVPRLNDV